MRIVSWNCNERFDRKYTHLFDLGFDVAVVAECGPFEPRDEQASALTQVMRSGTGLPGHKKHIAVLARDPWSVEQLDPIPGHQWILPTRVSGPFCFTLLAVWALGSGYVGGLRYVDQLALTIDEVLPAIDGPVVIAGDFNAPGNLTPDGRNADRINKHHANVAKLNELGYVSAFTAARGAEVDPLSEATYFHYRKRERPFHLDHVFLPETWADGIEVEIGSYDDWIAPKISDHTPVVVDVEPRQ